MLYYYGGSLMKALQSIYPTFPWSAWRFSMPHQLKGQGKFSKIQYLLFRQIQEVTIRTC